jgi:hypothetical protein
MHFRVRKNVIQLIRTTYDGARKKGNSAIIGRVQLARPELTAELRASLTDGEVASFETWLKTQRRSETLREELAALTVAETMNHAQRWFEREGDSPAARAAAQDILSHWQALRRLFARKGLLD